MKHTLTFFFVLFALALLPAAAFAEGEVDDALDEVRDAMDLGLDASRSCRTRVVPELRVARDELKSMKTKLKLRQLRRTREDLRALRRDVVDICPAKLGRHLQTSTRSLAAALDKVDRGREHARRHPRQELATTYVCWDARDPGCDLTRDGQRPMGEAEFVSLLHSLDLAGPNIFSMADVAEAGLRRGHVTSLQLAAVLGLFRNHIFTMEDLVEVAAPRLIDAEHGAVVAEMFRPYTIKVKDVNARLVRLPRSDRARQTKKARRSRGYDSSAFASGVHVRRR